MTTPPSSPHKPRLRVGVCDLSSLGNMRSHVTTLIESLETEEITEAEALAKLQVATGRIVDADWHFE